MGKLITVCYKCGSRNVKFVQREIKNGRYPGDPNASPTRSVDAMWCEDCKKYRCNASEELIAEVYNKVDGKKVIVEDVSHEGIARFHKKNKSSGFNKEQLVLYMSMTHKDDIIKDYIRIKYPNEKDITYKLLK